jgi:hypothetical protein
VQYLFSGPDKSQDGCSDSRYAGRENQTTFGFLMDRKPVLDNFEVGVIEP